MPPNTFTLTKWTYKEGRWQTVDKRFWTEELFGGTTRRVWYRVHDEKTGQHRDYDALRDIKSDVEKQLQQEAKRIKYPNLKL